jgi:hypothetical protein
VGYDHETKEMASAHSPLVPIFRPHLDKAAGGARLSRDKKLVVQRGKAPLKGAVDDCDRLQRDTPS